MVASFSISAILTAKFELEIGMFLCDNHFQWFKRFQYFNFEKKFLKNENEGTFSLWVFLKTIFLLLPCGYFWIWRNNYQTKKENLITL